MAKPPNSLLLPNRKSHIVPLGWAYFIFITLKISEILCDNWPLLHSAQRQAADLTVFCCWCCVTDHHTFVLKTHPSNFPAVPDSLMSINWICIQSLYVHSSCSAALFKERLEVCRFTLAQHNEAAGMSYEESCTGAVYKKEKCMKYTFHARWHQPLHPQLHQKTSGLIYEQRVRNRLGELPHLN